LRGEITENFDQKLYSYFGYDCFLHLSRVTAGLDSAIVVETEIQGQVKMAYEQAMQYTKLPYEIHYLFQNCLSVGKKVRSELPIKPGLPDLEHSIFQAGQYHFEIPQCSQVLFVGASDINRKVIAFLKAKKFQHITLCNRTYAKNIAEEESIHYLDWYEMCRWHEFDWIIFGTKSPFYLISRNHVPNNINHKLIMDLCVPRNVDPQISKDKRITLLNIDHLMDTLKGRRNKLLKAIHTAERIVTETAKQKVATFHLKQHRRLSLQIG
jgi:glutamyl-tRNA reductase